jgi:hypothetical protein
VVPTPTVYNDGVEIPLDEVKQYFELGKAIRENGLVPEPTGQQQQQQQTPPEPTPPVIPEFIDQDDEVQMGLWNKLQEVEQKFGTLSEQTQAANMRLVRQQAQQQLDSALSSFKTKYPGIDDQDLSIIRPMAAQLLPAVQQNTPNPVEAMERSLFIAAVENPTISQKIISPAASTQQQASATRKRKQSSIGGSSGSASRTPSRPTPKTDSSMVDQLASAIEEAYSSNGRLN